jgi:hypothetical protein
MTLFQSPPSDFEEESLAKNVEWIHNGEGGICVPPSADLLNLCISLCKFCDEIESRVQNCFPLRRLGILCLRAKYKGDLLKNGSVNKLVVGIISNMNACLHRINSTRLGSESESAPVF